MSEQNVGNLDVKAILANEELMKKLAAKVLDIIQQKPDAGVVCQGYYCNMAKGDQPEEWNSLCKKKLDSLDMELEDGLAASVAEDYPLSATELDQVVTEIKTSEAYSGKLSRTDMSRAVSKVLADNEIMRRKGSAEAMKDSSEKIRCTPDGFSLPCHTCGPDQLSVRSFSPCRPCGPNEPSTGSFSTPCLMCGPNKPSIFSTPCRPWGPWHGGECHICGPDQLSVRGFSIPCRTWGPGQGGCSAKFWWPDGCPGYFDLGPIDREDIVGRPGVEELMNRVNRLEAMIGLRKS